MLSAVTGGNLDAVRAAIDADSSDLNCCEVQAGESPLMAAIRLSHLKIAGVLLDKGANPNLRCTATGTNAGYTAMHAAARTGDGDAVALLKRHGGDPDAAGEDGWCPMHVAAFSGKSAALVALVKAGADVNKLNAQGVPPIVFTANHGRAADTRALIEHGASMDLQDQTGDSLLHHTFHFQMSKLFEGEYDVPDVQLDVAVVLAIAGAPVDLKNHENKGATEWMDEATPALADVLRVLAHCGAAFRASKTQWNYMTVLGAGIEHFVGLGLEMKHAVDLYEKVRTFDAQRLKEKKRREEERPPGGCPVMRGKKKSKSADAAPPAGGSHSGQSMADAEKAKAAGEDPSGGQCPFFKKPRVGGTAFSPTAGTPAPREAPLATIHTQSATDVVAVSPLADGWAAFVHRNATTILLVALAFASGMILEQKLGGHRALPSGEFAKRV